MQQIIEAIEKMTVMELVELKKALEEKPAQKPSCDWEAIKEETIPEEDNEKAVESYVLPKNKI